MKMIVFSKGGWMENTGEQAQCWDCVFDLALAEVVIFSCWKLCLLLTVWASDANSLSLSITRSHGVTNATVAAALCFPFHTRQLFIQCLQPPLLSLFILFFLPLTFLTFFFGLSAALSPVLPIIEGLSTLIHCVWQVCAKRLLLPIIVLVTAVFFTHSASYQDR